VDLIDFEVKGQKFYITTRLYRKSFLTLIAKGSVLPLVVLSGPNTRI
jgi:hypothetical protein